MVKKVLEAPSGGPVGSSECRQVHRVYSATLAFPSACDSPSVTGGRLHSGSSKGTHPQGHPRAQPARRERGGKEQWLVGETGEAA